MSTIEKLNIIGHILLGVLMGTASYLIVRRIAEALT